MRPHAHVSGEASVQGGGGQWETRLANTRHLLLDKLIRHSQKQSLGRSLAAWLRSIEVRLHLHLSLAYTSTSLSPTLPPLSRPPSPVPSLNRG